MLLHVHAGALWKGAVGLTLWLQTTSGQILPSSKKKKRDWHNHIPAWSVLLLYSEIRQWNKPPPLPFLCISLGCHNSATWPNHTMRCCYLGYLIRAKLFFFYIGFNKPFAKEFLHHLLILQLYLWKASCKNCNQDFLFF